MQFKPVLYKDQLYSAINYSHHVLHHDYTCFSVNLFIS